MQLLRTEFERRRFADAMARSYIEGAIEIGQTRYGKGRLAMGAGVLLSLEGEVRRLERLQKGTAESLRITEIARVEAAIDARHLEGIREMAEQALLGYRWRRTRRAWIEYASVLRIAGILEYSAMTESADTLPVSGRIGFRLAEDHETWSSRKRGEEMFWPTLKPKGDTGPVRAREEGEELQGNSRWRNTPTECATDAGARRPNGG